MFNTSLCYTTFGVTLLLVILPMGTTFSRELLIVYDSNKMGGIYTDSLSFQEDLGVYSLPTTTPQILQPWVYLWSWHSSFLWQLHFLPCFWPTPLGLVIDYWNFQLMKCKDLQFVAISTYVGTNDLKITFYRSLQKG